MKLMPLGITPSVPDPSDFGQGRSHAQTKNAPEGARRLSMSASKTVPKKVTTPVKVAAEASIRRIRRMTGLIKSAFSDDLLNRITDPRSTQGRRWKSCFPLLRATLIGLACGCRGFAEVERLTERMSKPARKLAHISRRVPDTTLRDFVKELDVNEVQKLLNVVAYDAGRRKSFAKRQGMPFHALSIDGKYPFFKVEGNSSYYAQDRHDKETGEYQGSLLRTLTASLVTAPGRPILNATPVPHHTNEMGAFQKSLGDLVRVFGKQFELVMYPGA